MKKLCHILWVFWILILLSITVVSAGSSESIRVGVILPLTGRLSRLGGKIEQRSFLMAAEEINRSGGIHGKQIELIIEDTVGRPDLGHSAVEKLVSKEKVVVLSGGMSSVVTRAAVAVAQKLKIPFLVNTASADRLTERGWEYVFRLNPPMSEHPKTLRSFLKAVAKPRSLGIIYENTPFGQFWLKKFIKQYRSTDLKLVIKEEYRVGATDFRPLLLRLKEKDPDMIYLISHLMDAALIVRQIKESALNPGFILGHAAAYIHPEFHKYAKESSEYICSTSIWAPSAPYEGAKDYYENFVARYNEPPDYHGAQAHAAMYVIADALRRARSLEPKDVRDALSETKMMTVFGPVRFISYGRKRQQNKLPTLLFQWLKGRPETVWPRNMATAHYVYPMPKWFERYQ
jgi:branched-chain amino acid transport system substrate-binding protein